MSLKVFIRSNTWVYLWFIPSEPHHEKTCFALREQQRRRSTCDPCSLINLFVLRCLDSIIPLVSVSKISSLYLASVAAQAGLSLPGQKSRRQVFSWHGSSVILTICDSYHLWFIPSVIHTICYSYWTSIVNKNTPAKCLHLLLGLFLSSSNLSWGHNEGLWTARGPYHSGSPGPGQRAVNKPSSCPQLRFLLLLVHWTAAQS